jgi:hypothetical protein
MMWIPQMKSIHPSTDETVSTVGKNKVHAEIPFR